MSVTRSDVDYVQDPHTAARLYLEAAHQAEHAKRTGQTGLFTESRATMNRVSKEWPEAPELAATASDQDLGGLSAGLKRTRDAHRKALGHTSQTAANARRRGSQPHKPAGPGAGGGGKAPGGGRPTAHRPILSRSTRRAAAGAADYITPPQAEGVGQLAFQTFGWGVGLSLLYLLLTNAERAPRGRSAIELVTRGMSNTIAVLVSPHADPLSPRLAHR